MFHSMNISKIEHCQVFFRLFERYLITFEQEFSTPLISKHFNLIQIKSCAILQSKQNNILLTQQLKIQQAKKNVQPDFSN